MKNNFSKEEQRANIAELKGLLSEAIRNKQEVALVKIPVRLLTIDEAYQTPIRTNRSLSYLIDNWDESKLQPLQGFPHMEEGLVYLTDGYGRTKASQIIDAEKYEYLWVLISFKAPKEEEARREYEAEMYAYQNANVSDLTPVQRHGAVLLIKNDPMHKAALTFDYLQKKYHFTYKSEKGKREPGCIGSYNTLMRILKTAGDNREDCGNYIFEVCKNAGMNLKENGYAGYILFSLRDIWKYYPEDREETKDLLSKILRPVNPDVFSSKAVAKYPEIYKETACSLYLEDLVSEELRLPHIRTFIDGKLTKHRKLA